MSMHQIERQFTRIGARAKVHPPIVRRWETTPEISIDIGNDGDGEFFDISVKPGLLDDTEVIDVQPKDRHLLLMSRQEDGKHKFLCGHDERHWFVAAVPERRSVSSVKTAFDALKPTAVRTLEKRLGVKPRKRNRRRNEAFIRQGAAAGSTMLPKEIEIIVNELLPAHGEEAVTRALERAVRFSRFRADDVRSILAIGPPAPEPAPAGDQVVIDLPVVEQRALDAYRIGGLA